MEEREKRVKFEDSSEAETESDCDSNIEIKRYSQRLARKKPIDDSI